MTTQTTLRIATLLTVFAVGAGIATTGCSEKKQGNAQSGGRPAGAATAVEALIIEPQPLENSIYTTGSMLANEEVELRSEISGRVTGVFFEEGSRVKKGALMLQINDRELQAELTRKQLEEKLASDEEHRKRSLLDIKGISQEEYDKALNALKMVQAEKDVIESQLAETRITAPFDGVVGLRYVSEGGYVTPAMLAATMQDIDPMKVEFSVPEKYASMMKNGLEVGLQVGDQDGKRIGKVYAVESKIDPGTRTIKARARIPNPDNALVPGSFARVQITLEQIPDAIVIPAEAVIPELGGEKVFVFRGGKSVSTPVKTGIRTENRIQITEGLVVNDTLILTGLLQLGDGKAVQIQSIRPPVQAFTTK